MEHIYAVALNSAGRGAEAITVRKTGLARPPADRDILLALASFSRDADDVGGALQ